MENLTILADMQVAQQVENDRSARQRSHDEATSSQAPPPPPPNPADRVLQNLVSGIDRFSVSNMLFGCLVKGKAMTGLGRSLHLQDKETIGRMTRVLLAIATAGEKVEEVMQEHAAELDFAAVRLMEKRIEAAYK